MRSVVQPLPPGFYPPVPVPHMFPQMTQWPAAPPAITDTSRDVPPPGSGNGPQLKRVDKVLDPLTGQWVVSDTPASVYAKEGKGNDADAAQYTFVVERTLQYPQGPHNPVVHTQLLIHNEALIGALNVVMKNVQNLSWHVKPFSLLPQTVLAFVPHLKTYLEDLTTKKNEENWEKTAAHLGYFTEFLESEYEEKLKQISSLLSHGEMTFELLWAIHIPHTVLFSSCSTTSEPRAYRLLDSQLQQDERCRPFWNLTCDYIDFTGPASSSGQTCGRATTFLKINYFAGAVKISELAVFPLEWYPNLPSLQQKLIERGKKWLGLNSIHHMSYNALAYRTDDCNKKQFRVNGRIMIDRGSFADAEPNYGLQVTAQWNMPPPQQRNRPERQRGRGARHHSPLRGAVQNFPFSQPGPPQLGSEGTGVDDLDLDNSLTDEALLLTTPILHGFSLSEKKWMEFNVEYVTPIQWNDETFKNLAIDSDRKLLIQSLVESHAQDQPIDDFVQGKGLGLVINLFGPPGVGKSLTVEATSEHLRKPLYVVSAGDLGTKPDHLDEKLTKIFSMTPVWNAVVLIDEADVFLEERGTHDIARNAMVAVFLRQIEYFHGILFLTTNRVKTFDQAFQSRIHLSLRYEDLTCALKGQIWGSFLRKAADSRAVGEFSAEELRLLSEEDLNGRQIKNVVKMAVALAGHSNEIVTFKHLVRTLDAMGRYKLSEKRLEV